MQKQMGLKQPGLGISSIGRGVQSSTKTITLGVNGVEKACAEGNTQKWAGKAHANAMKE